MYLDRLRERIGTRGALCVGLDPQPSVLDAWDLPHTAGGVERCARGLIEAIGDQVAVFKPQSAFFEVFGAAGVAVLERVLADIRAVGALSVLDVKRGDIGSTMAGYASAYLADDAPLAADAITLAPYLGFESLRRAIDLAAATRRGVYVLARTSNPEGANVQLALDTDGRRVAQCIVDAATQANLVTPGTLGLVVGGTHADLGIDVSGFNGSILVPGIGAQGGRMEDLAATFGPALPLVLPTLSREVLFAGPDPTSLANKVAVLLTSTKNDMPK